MCRIVGSAEHDNERLPASEQVIEASVSGPSKLVALPPDGLTDQQREFVRQFVLLGKSGEAALAAGYGHDTYGTRLLARKKVQAEIARQVKMQTGSALAMAMARLLRIVETSTDDRAAVAAALGLMDRFGMAPPKGPAVAVQVNNIGGPAASAVLQQVAERAAARLKLQGGG